MRNFIAAALVLVASSAAAQKLDVTRPEDAVAAQRKLQCSLEDGKPVRWWWHGRVYSRVPGERDRLLFNVEGTNIRQCATIKDDKKGVGYRLVSREILLYLDPKTNEVVRSWNNPWTGEAVDVLHVANDPVNSRPSFPFDDAGKPAPGAEWKAEFKDGRGMVALEVPLFYTNPLQGEYQPFVGGTYHAMEMFNFFFDQASLLERKGEVKNAEVSWVRVSNFLPWMKMGDRTGILIFNTVGRRVGSYDEMPAVLKKEIDANYAIYKEPPPLDDARPNETSWTYFKKVMDAKKPKG